MRCSSCECWKLILSLFPSLSLINTLQSVSQSISLSLPLCQIISLCLPVWLSVSICLSLCVSVRLSLSLSDSLCQTLSSVCQTLSVSDSLFLSLSDSLCLTLCQTLCVCQTVSVSDSLSLSVPLSLKWWVPWLHNPRTGDTAQFPDKENDRMLYNERHLQYRKLLPGKNPVQLPCFTYWLTCRGNVPLADRTHTHTHTHTHTQTQTHTHTPWFLETWTRAKLGSYSYKN